MGKKFSKCNDRPKSRMSESRRDFLIDCFERDMSHILEKIILILPKTAVLSCIKVSSGWKEMVLSFQRSELPRIQNILERRVNVEWTRRTPIVQQVETAGLICRDDSCMSADKENIFFYSFLHEEADAGSRRDTISVFDSKSLQLKQVLFPGHLDVSRKLFFLNENFLIFTTLRETLPPVADHFIFDRKRNCDLISVVNKRLPWNCTNNRRDGFSLNGDCLLTHSRHKFCKYKRVLNESFDRLNLLSISSTLDKDESDISDKDKSNMSNLNIEMAAHITAITLRFHPIDNSSNYFSTEYERFRLNNSDGKIIWEKTVKGHYAEVQTYNDKYVAVVWKSLMKTIIVYDLKNGNRLLSKDATLISNVQMSSGRVAFEIGYMDLNSINLRTVCFVEVFDIESQSVIFNSLTDSNLTTNKLLLLQNDRIFMEGSPADGTTGQLFCIKFWI